MAMNLMRANNSIKKHQAFQREVSEEIKEKKNKQELKMQEVMEFKRKQ